MTMAIRYLAQHACTARIAPAIGRRAALAARTSTSTTLSAQRRSFESCAARSSAWPAGARDEEADEAEAQSKGAADAAGDGEGAQGKGEGEGGDSGPAPMQRISRAKSGAAGSAFQPHSIRPSQDELRDAAAAAFSRLPSRPGPALEDTPPSAAAQDKAAPAPAEAQESETPAGPGMGHIADVKRKATPQLGSEATVERQKALQRADEAVKAVHRKGGRGIARDGAAGAAAASSAGPSAVATDAQAQTQAAQPQSQLPQVPRQKTIMYLEKMKNAGTPIACLTAYDYPTALSLRSADVDICLVGDSLANVALGHSTTQPLTMSQMIHHCQAVQRGLSSPTLTAHSTATPFVVADMPFGTFAASLEEGVRNAIQLVQEGGVEAVKVEGGREVLPFVRRLTEFGIPVMGHLGLQPQRVASTSGYRVQGRTAERARAIWENALALQDAGVFSIVLECVPSVLARAISARLNVPTIGIGAGPGADGQILVMSDMMGELTSPSHVIAGLAPSTTFSSASSTEVARPLPIPSPHAPAPPKFVRSFAAPLGIGALRMRAVADYVEAVRNRTFPDEHREGYKMRQEEWQEFCNGIEESEKENERISSGDVWTK